LHSSRLAQKVLADLAGAPMVVRVAQRAALSGARQVVVAADDPSIVQACQAHQVACVLTHTGHTTGSDRLAQACHLLGLSEQEVVVNVQGDEPLIAPDTINACAKLLRERSECAMSTAAHAIESVEEFSNPNVVKVVSDQQGRALYFSRASIPYWRDAPTTPAGLTAFETLPPHAPLRHIGLYAYSVQFLYRFCTLAPAPMEHIESLEQLRVLWHGERIAVHICAQRPAPGVDTQEDLERVRMLFLGVLQGERIAPAI
jgi:3-deoxy-manno-octulosonate cytidylyltransferase (CMP-KDO synthetase)